MFKRALAMYLFCFSLLLFNFPISVFAAGHIDITTQHNDNARTGANLLETSLNTSNVNVEQFGKLFSIPVDGHIYAQPLYLSNMDIGGKTRNVIYVATMHNTVYCFDADDPAGVPLWSVNLGPSVPLPDDDIGWGMNYKDIMVEIGILSTPVIDRANNTIYLVAMTKVDGEFRYHLHALDIRTGEGKLAEPKLIEAVYPGKTKDGHSFTWQWRSNRQSQRSALTLANGRVYFGSASFADTGTYNGWILGYNAQTLEQEVVYNTTPDCETLSHCEAEGGVWMSSQGVTVDEEGNIYFMTGNGATDIVDGPNRGSSIVKLSGAAGTPAEIVDWFTPFNYEYLNYQDLDLSSGLLLVPGTNFLIGGGKEGRLYVVDKTNLGKYHVGDDSQIVASMQHAAVGNIHSSPIYWEGPAGNWFYIWGESDRLKAYKVDFNAATGQYSFPLVSQSTFTAPMHKMPGGFLSVSSNGNQAGSGIIWANIPQYDDANQKTVDGVLRAFDANDLSKELWNSELNPARDDSGNFGKFAAPTVANGKVYLATFSNQLMVYGLLSSDATLQNLTSSIVSLNPAFHADHLNYNVTVGSDMDSISLTPTANEIHASIKINDQTLDSGTSSAPISLNLGDNTINIAVTAQNGNKKTYTINVYKSNNNAYLSTLSMSGGSFAESFASEFFNYSATVPNETNAITLAYTLQDTNAKTVITLNGSAVTGAIPLTVGPNDIRVEVTADDGTTKQTYKINVTRLASPNAFIHSITLSGITINPGVTSDIYEYQATVPNDIDTTQITIVPADSQATTQAFLDDLPINQTIPLKEGLNVIKAVVTSQDGNHTQTYTLSITRDSPVFSMTLSGIALNQSVQSSVYDYTATVPYHISSTVLDAKWNGQPGNPVLQLNGDPIINPIPLDVGINEITVKINQSAQPYHIQVKRIDDVAPQWPAGTKVHAIGIASTQATLNWTPATDNIGVTGYRLYSVHAGTYTPVQTLGNVLTATLTGLNPDTPYTYTLRAIDGAGNESGNSPIETLTTKHSDDPDHNDDGHQHGPGDPPVGGPPMGGPPAGPGPAAPVASPDVNSDESDAPTEVKINLKKAAKVTEGTNEQGQPKITVTIDTELLAKALAAKPQAQRVIIEIPGSDGNARLLVPISTLKGLSGKNALSVVYNRIAGSPLEQWKQAAQEQGVQLATNPFVVHLYIDGKEVDDFPDAYLGITISVTGAITPYQSTAVSIDPIHKLRFVPSSFTGGDGKAEITIFSPYNGPFAITKAFKSFRDLNGHWSEQNVTELANKLIVDGTGEAEFSPNKAITRAEFTALLVRSLGLADKASDKSFRDIREADWFAAAIATALNAGLVSGIDEQSFMPNETINREQMLVMISRALELAGKDNTADIGILDSFKDVGDIAGWAKKAAAQALDAHIIEGAPGNSFNAKQDASRAQAAVMLKRMLQYLQFIN
ncbi:cadherin-like beta sandwich domain-containing protein [Cohnella silvisoli]|uniref:Cadherin-like beta sandwich domain-containing protein n=1 Tax=Cohnella silvisoli TaxID=2873699 RepID=A0ABV1KU57_9BACL|nr:cadherin-like beta sandwich domain-containing protein [Cohnella silvisoli]MCD9022921.1 cadherin-like beta sandwich domain-containing protein [Cohnella silvisoli]